MDKYGLSNETRLARDDVSALYHMLLCGRRVGLDAEAEGQTLNPESASVPLQLIFGTQWWRSLAKRM